MIPPGRANAFTSRLSTTKNCQSRSGREVVRAMESPSCRTYSAVTASRTSGRRPLICSALCRPIATSWSLLTPQAQSRRAMPAVVSGNARMNQPRSARLRLRLRRTRHEGVRDALPLLFAPAVQQRQQVVTLDGRGLAAHGELAVRRRVVQRIERSRCPRASGGVGEQVDRETRLADLV